MKKLIAVILCGMLCVGNVQAMSKELKADKTKSVLKFAGYGIMAGCGFVAGYGYPVVAAAYFFFRAVQAGDKAVFVEEEDLKPEPCEVCTQGEVTL
jgi:hypothetical protein